MKNQNYVAGFLFDHTQRFVALIEKLKPDWQKGKLNAIGGKIEEDDKNPQTAMTREFQEETGLLVTDWRLFCTLSFRGGNVYFFTAFSADVWNVRTIEDEKVATYSVDRILSDDAPAHIPNLRWLIPLALDKDALTATVEDLS